VGKSGEGDADRGTSAKIEEKKKVKIFLMKQSETVIRNNSWMVLRSARGNKSQEKAQERGTLWRRPEGGQNLD